MIDKYKFKKFVGAVRAIKLKNPDKPISEIEKGIGEEPGYI